MKLQQHESDWEDSVNDIYFIKKKAMVDVTGYFGQEWEGVNSLPRYPPATTAGVATTALSEMMSRGWTWP